MEARLATQTKSITECVRQQAAHDLVDTATSLARATPTFADSQLAVVTLQQGRHVTVPTRFDHYGLLLTLAGSCELTVGAHAFHVPTNGLVLLSPNVLIGFEGTSDDFRASLLLFRKEFLMDGFIKEGVLEELLVTNPDYLPLYQLEPHYSPFVQRKFIDATLEVTGHQPFYLNMARLLIIELLYEFNRFNEHSPLLATRRMNRQYQLTQQFKQLVDAQFARKKTVAEYADLMHLSANYLSEAVKGETGSSALEVIHSRLLREAQYLLGHTERSIKEVADGLQFDTTSHFARFFKQKMNVTPQGYRMTVAQAAQLSLR